MSQASSRPASPAGGNRCHRAWAVPALAFAVVRHVRAPFGRESVRSGALDPTRNAQDRTFSFIRTGARSLHSDTSASNKISPNEKGSTMDAARKPRLLVAKPGLDGHDRGAKYVAHILRDAGFEVIYTGIRRSPEQIVEAAIQEDVSAIGLSLLSGAHAVLFKRVLDLLEERHARDIIVFGGGTIPPADAEMLKEMGVAAVFTPGAPAREIIDTIEALLAEKQAV
jgi:methylmalonyl-CoA mutase C-terminal domain/subunit